MTIARETMIFFFSLILGAGLGSIYDIFRILRIAFPSGNKLIFIEDGIFVLIFTVLTFLFSISFCNGYLRLFVLTGEILGFILYYFTVGMVVIKCSKVIISWFKFLLKKLYAFFIRPLVVFFKYILHKVVSIFKHISQKFFKGFFAKKFHLKKHNVMMYNEEDNMGLVSAEESGTNREKEKKHT